jgi:hypothetical protein
MQYTQVYYIGGRFPLPIAIFSQVQAFYIFFTAVHSSIELDTILLPAGQLLSSMSRA